MASWEQNLIDGIGEFLDARNLCSWRGFDAAYQDADIRRMYLGPDMPSKPDEILVVTPGVRTYIRADITINIQFRTRGAAGGSPLAVSDWSQQIMDAFYPNGFPLTRTLFGSVAIGLVSPGDTLPMSRDESRRHGYIQNFRFRGRRPRPE